MARLSRLALAGQLHLLIQRGHGGQPVFVDAEDHAEYLDRLREAALLHRVAVHGYALAGAEVLLLATPDEASGLSAMVQSVGRRFVAGYNRRHGRRGALWEARFASTVVDAASHGLDCLRLVELAPVHAGIAASALDHRWSSARHHVGDATDPWLVDHAVLWALGNTPFEREAAWRLRLEQPMPPQERNLLRRSTLRGWVLGGEAFRSDLADQTPRRLIPLNRGRPQKAVPKPNGI